MKNKRDFDSFDEFAKDYREIHNENIKATGVDSDYFSSHKIIELKKHEHDTNVSVLDFGCGDGNSFQFFKKHFKGINYTGIDVSKESINEAKIKYHDDSIFEVFDGFNIPFENDTFDIVFVACVLHHINHDYHKDIIKEIKRVLKKGGRLYIFEHNPLNPVTKHIVNTCPFDKDAVLIYPLKMKSTLSEINFTSNSIRFILFFPRNIFFRIFLFLEKYLIKFPLGGQYYTKSIK